MQAFSGFTVVDFTQVLSGPVATQMLALMGAEVIKIEPPGQGDQMRSILTDAEMAAKLLSPAFLTVNLGKRSVALDLKSEAGRAAAHILTARADVVVENFRPGVAAKLGIDAASVRKRNSTVVYCSISGYGQDGPKSGERAYDSAVQADSGLMTLTGHPETGPTRTGFMGIDLMTGMSAAFAISAALLRRERSGEGQVIDVAMMDTAMAMMAPQMADYLVRGNLPELIGNGSALAQPTVGGFHTADGYVNIMTVTPTQQEAALKAMGLGALLDDPRFASMEARRTHAEAGREHVVAMLASKSTADWLKILKDAGVPVQAVRTFPEVAADDQWRHRGVMVRAEGIDGLDGPATLIGAPFITDADGPNDHAVPPGTVGQHTQEVLAQHGFTEAEIDAVLNGA